MKADTVVRARIDKETKEAAAKALASMGLSVSDFIRIALKKVAMDKEIPFRLRVPNDLTRRTLEKSSRGEDVHPVENAGELYDRLGI